MQYSNPTHGAVPAPTETEKIVAQYSPEWVEAVTSGAAVRHGNIIEVGQ